MRESFLPASVLILVVVLLRRLLRGRISPRLQYALWLPVAIRLLVPGPLFPAPVSVAGAARELSISLEEVRQEAPPAAGLPRPVLPDQCAGVPESAAPEIPAPGPDSGPRRAADWPGLLWKAGMVLTAAALTASDLTLARRLRKCRKRLYLPPDTGAWEIPVYLAEELASPCLFGVLRPAVYVSREALRAEHFEHILLHEQTHRRHGDHLWALVRSVCLVIHWYNPLVWLAASLSRRDCELSCDDGVIRRLGEARRLDYGATLLKMVVPGRTPADLLRTATTMTAGKRTMVQRISFIAHRPRMLKITLAAVVLVMCGAVVLTFGGRAEAESPPDGGDSAVQEVLALLEEARGEDGVLSAVYFAGSLGSGSPAIQGGVDREYPLEAAFASCQWTRTEAPDGEPDCEHILSVAGFFFYSGSPLVRRGGDAMSATPDPAPAEKRWYIAEGAYEAVDAALQRENRVRETPMDRPLSAGTLDDRPYDHPSGMFSLTVPEAWVGEVAYTETEDGVIFYDNAADQERGWLMSVLPNPTSWADAYNRSDILLTEFDFNGSPYTYVLELNREPDYSRDRERTQALMEAGRELADGFRMTATRESAARLVYGNSADNMPLAITYLPYLDWDCYAGLYGEEEAWELLMELWDYAREAELDWGQYHDILSSRTPRGPGAAGTYANGYPGVVWTLYERNPQWFASVLGSVYLTEDERADVLSWIRRPLSEEAGLGGDELLTDAEIYRHLGLTPDV